MANKTNLFQFFRRYKWRAQDFDALQIALIEAQKGAAEGSFGASALSGLDVGVSGATLNVAVQPGILVSPTGDLCVVTTANLLACIAPVSGVSLNLIVARPKLVENVAIARPTSPFDSVFLRKLLDVELVFISGTAGLAASYPSPGANDTVLAGIKLIPGQTVLLSEDLDFDVRDLPVKNKNLGQDSFRYDSRLQPYKATSVSVGIKPAQTIGSHPMMFLDAGFGQPSIYPKDGSGFFSQSDSFLNMSSGVITGGDIASPDFTPTTPTGNNSIVATIYMNALSDTVSVSYGVQGTLLQCLDGIRSQKTAGAGSIATVRGKYKISYAIVSSRGGVFSDLRVIDARSLGGGSGSSSGGGPALVWIEGNDSPTSSVYFNNSVYEFDPAGAQGLYASVRVPDSYVPGTQGFLKIKALPGDSSGNVLFVGETTLYRTADALSTAVNVHSSVNAALAIVAQDKSLEFTIDLTDSVGAINAVSVSPGDILKIRITRSTDTSAATARLMYPVSQLSL